MDIIPVINIKKKQIQNFETTIGLSDLLNDYHFKNLYVMDHDGIDKNHPNFSMYQKLSAIYNLWIDAGSRDIGDVVDDVFSGATNIIIRQKLWDEPDFKSIRDITDSKIFVVKTLDEILNQTYQKYIFDEADGFIIISHGYNQRIDFKSESIISDLSLNKPLFVYESDKTKQNYWKKNDVKGFLVDITKVDEWK